MTSILAITMAGIFGKRTAISDTETLTKLSVTYRIPNKRLDGYRMQEYLPNPSTPPLKPSHGGNTCPTLPTTFSWATVLTALPCAPWTPAAMPASLP